MNPRSSRFFAAALLAAAWSGAHAQVTVEDPWVRGVVAGQSATGAFMTIRSTEATELVGVASPVASMVSLHKMAMANGMMSMAPIEALAVPANGKVELKPGAYHVMLVGLTRALEVGAEVPLTLTFRDGRRKETVVTVQARVRDVTGAPAAVAK